MREITEILICFQCNGSGVIPQTELTDHHRGEYTKWDIVCKGCKGSGRQMKTTTVTLAPYDNAAVSMLLLKGSAEDTQTI